MNPYDWDKIFNNSTLKAMQESQKFFSKFDFPVNNYFSQINKFAAIANSPAIQIIKTQQSLYNAMYPFEQTLRAIEKLGIPNHAITQTPSFSNKFREMESVLRPCAAFLSIIEDGNTAFRAFNNSGIFEAVAGISNTISVFTAMKKLNALLPIVELIDYSASFSEDNTILVDDVVISRDEILEIAKEFETLPLDASTDSQKIDKLKSKKGKLFLSIIWIILYHLFFVPVIDDSLDVAREYLGINKILEKIEIKRWADDIFNNNSDETLWMNEVTILELKSILEDLKADRGDHLLDITSVLHKAGIKWDKAISAREERNPKDFFDFFDNYSKMNYESCKIYCEKIDIDLLASLLAHEARQLTHWDEYYTPDNYPFFIAGIEKLIYELSL
jgi:hypothetical protein